jgi:hypothetical protein
MKIGDLVKFVGVANYYKDTVGIVTKLYNTGAGDTVVLGFGSAIVYIANKPEGRSLPGLGQAGIPCFHPLAFDELEVVSGSR